MERPHIYKARFLVLAALRQAWAQRTKAWAFLLFPLPAFVLSFAKLLVHADATTLTALAIATLPLSLVLQNVPWALGGGLGEVFASASPQHAQEGLSALQPRAGRLVWLGLRYVFNLWGAGLKGCLASSAVALVYFVLTSATGFLDHRGTAAVFKLLVPTFSVIACALLVGYFVARVVADMFMAPIWVVRGLEVNDAIARSREFAVGRFWHILAVLGWLTLLPCVVTLGVFVFFVSGVQATDLDQLSDLFTRFMSTGTMYIALANWLMAPIAGMSPALMERQELAWAMPSQTPPVPPMY